MTNLDKVSILFLSENLQVHSLNLLPFQTSKKCSSNDRVIPPFTRINQKIASALFRVLTPSKLYVVTSTGRSKIFESVDYRKKNISAGQRPSNGSSFRL